MTKKFSRFDKKILGALARPYFKYNPTPFRVGSAKGGCGALITLMLSPIKTIGWACWVRQKYIAIVIIITISLAFLIKKIKLNGYNLLIFTEIVSNYNTFFDNLIILLSLFILSNWTIIISLFKQIVFNFISKSKFNPITFTILLSLVLCFIINSLYIGNDHELPFFFLALGFKFLSVLLLILIILYLIMS